MEICISNFFKRADLRTFSGSVATHGKHAARDTWEAAKTAAVDLNFLHTDKKRDAFKRHLESGGFSENMETFTHAELNALLMQCIAADIHESGLDTNAPDWEDYQRQSEAGQISGGLFLGVDGEVYFSFE